jgi:hypothetical protein
MYTNIPTSRALREIAHYLHTTGHRYCDVHIKAIIAALHLVMTNNIFTFGDTCWKQTSGTAMGTPPAPPYATLYYAIHEEKLLEEYGDNLLLYKRFIDDVLGIWVVTDPATDTARWNSFQASMNDYHGLVWEHSARCTKLDFMDLTLTIKNQRIHTTLYEKSLNLYLYIPPHSAHPPGVLSGLVMGMVYRIYTLCTDTVDIHLKVRQFYKRLLARGYKPDILRPLFRKAAANAVAPRTENDPAHDNNRIFFHLQYHPNDPPSSEIQKAWKECLATPTSGRPLSQLRNHQDEPIGLDRMIVCYRRPLNLSNLLSYRLIEVKHGPPVSSYRITNLERAIERAHLQAAQALDAPQTTHESTPMSPSSPSSRFERFLNHTGSDSSP